jgi:heme/copper-type cytochrome/quinol oxidase subunit 2
MTGEHPWREWFYILLILIAGIAVAVIAVKALIRWAHKDDEKNEKKQ